MSVEQSVQVGENISGVSRPAGFLDIRFNPALLNKEGTKPISTAEEQLLLVLHGGSKRLLVISNKSLTIYKLPSEAYEIAEPKKGIWKFFAWVVFGIKTVIGFTIFGDLLDALEKVWELFEWLWRKVSGKARREYEEVLQLILEQPDIILLKNPNKWIARYTAPFLNPVTITVEPFGVRILMGKKKGWMAYRDHSWGPINLAKELIESNRQALEAAGWSVEITNQGYVFKNSK